MRNFANKLWNASRFVMMNLTIDECELPETELELEDKWILSKLNTLMRARLRENLDQLRARRSARRRSTISSGTATATGISS